VLAKRVKAAVVLTCSALVSVWSSAQARDYFTPDGQFTICKFRQFKDCGELTLDIVVSTQFTENERDTLRKLQKIPGLAKLDASDLIEAFGKPTRILSRSGDPAIPDGLVYWWQTDAQQRDAKECPLCGVRIAFMQGQLFSIDYDVDNKFMIVWHPRLGRPATSLDPSRK
jgi:hypothetical protein